MARWTSSLESILFGTEDPDDIGRLLQTHCAKHLHRQLEKILFYRRGVGAVFGIRLDDQADIVVKVHRPDLLGRRLDGAVYVQRHLAELGLPAPRPLATPVPLGLGIATSEERIDGGRIGDGHDPIVRRILAQGLFRFVEAATSLGPRAGVLPGRLFAGGEDSLWPVPHDLRFDLSLPGGEWIDEIAAEAKQRLREPSGRLVVGHEDWRVENLRVDADQLAAIFDWDSVVLAHEPVLVGHNASGFTADWSDDTDDPFPSEEESAAFIAEYEAARGRSFTLAERATAGAAYLYSLAYKARCEHSDAQLGIFPDEGPGVGGWRGLLRPRAVERGAGSLVVRALDPDAPVVEALLDAAAEWQLNRGISQWRPGQFGDEVRSVIAAGDLYVSRGDGGIVGCFILETDCPDWMAHWLIERGRTPADAMYLGRLAVARELSGRGLGAGLLRSAKKIAAESGFGFLRLNCPAENERLRRFYVDAGFADLGDAELRGPAGEHWVCSVFESALPLGFSDGPADR